LIINGNFNLFYPPYFGKYGTDGTPGVPSHLKNAEILPLRSRREPEALDRQASFIFRKLHLRALAVAEQNNLPGLVLNGRGSCSIFFLNHPDGEKIPEKLRMIVFLH